MCKNKIKSEKGITLIALLVMIVILVILAAVSLGTIFGDEPLIKTATSTKENYKYTHYEEQVKQVAQGRITSKSAIGEIATIQNIQEALIDEEWVKTAKIDEGWTEDEGSIIVQVVEGYIYQVYYNSKYGKIIVDSIGKDIPEEDISNLKVTGRYEIQKGKPIVYGTATDETKGVKTIELYLDETDERIGEPKQNPEGEQSWQVERTGWYKIKGTSNSGAEKYAYVRVKNISDLLKAPTITIEPEGTQKAGWYGADGQALWVRISTDSKTAKEIHYTLTGGQLADDETGEIKEEKGQKYIRIQITETGITNIIAWTEDGNGNSSQEAKNVTKFDNIPPEIIKAEPIGTKGDNDWYKTNVNIEIDAVDLNGKTNLAEEDKRKTLNGYIYQITNEEGTILDEKTAEAPETDITKTIQLIEDEKYKITIKAIDQAGNISKEETKLEINKDETAPTIGTVGIDNITADTLDISVTAGDNLSGIATHEYKINGVTQNVPNQNTAHITGLTPDTTQTIEITITDNAGNPKTVTKTAKTKSAAPEVQEVIYKDKTTDSITVTARATHPRNENLIYTIYVSTDGTNWEDKGSTGELASGTTTDLTASVLAKYTWYYVKVRATESSTTQKLYHEKDCTPNKIRTYCPGTIPIPLTYDTIGCTR